MSAAISTDTSPLRTQWDRAVCISNDSQHVVSPRLHLLCSIVANAKPRLLGLRQKILNRQKPKRHLLSAATVGSVAFSGG